MKGAARMLPAFVVATALSSSSIPARAYFEETAAGARPLSLGFSALADVRDASAYYWNPAGLAGLGGTELLADVAKPYGVADLNEGTVAVATRRFDTGWALAWHHLGVTGVYGEELISVAAGRALGDLPRGHALFGGATFKYGRVGFSPFTDPATGGTTDYGSLAKGSLDVGLLWAMPWNVDLAWVVRDVLQPRYEFVPGSGGDRLEARQEVAAAYRWNEESTVTAGWSQATGGRTSINVGMEVLFYHVFAIRSGLTNIAPIYQSTGSPTEFQFTGGFGVFHKGYHVDAAAFTNRDLGASYRVTLRLRRQASP